MHERFFRWTMGVDWNCPWYMVREEVGREKIVLRQRKRAIGLENKLEHGRGSDIARECLIVRLLKQGDTKRRGLLSRWERGRNDGLEEGRKWSENDREIMRGWVKRMRWNGGNE